MRFKHYFEEKFVFTKASLPKTSKWNRVGDTSWALSFAYDKVNKTVGPVKSSEYDVYTIFVDKIADPFDRTVPNAMSSFASKYPDLVKNELYNWVVFDSSEHGSGITSKEEVPRAAKTILQTIVSALFLLLSDKQNIAFDAKKSEQSRVKLYSTLAHQFANTTGKKVAQQEFQNSVYFLVH